MVERKLARQHVDSKIAEQMKQQQEEHRTEVGKTPLATKTQGVKFQLESKDETNVSRLSTDDDSFSFHPTPRDGLSKYDMMDKENIPEISQQLRPQKQTGRASACPTVQKIYATPNLRRYSLLPQPTSHGTSKLPSSFLPLTPVQANKAEDGVEITCLPEQIPCDSPKDQRNRTKKLSSALRRSLHKKMNMKSPMQPPHRRIGVNVGMEKVRVSIGGRGKMGQRVLLGNGRRTVKDAQQKQQSHREKERGWNIGTTSARTLL